MIATTLITAAVDVANAPALSNWGLLLVAFLFVIANNNRRRA